MRPGSSLINTARGGIFSTDILQQVFQSLTSGHLWSFATDVLPVEPPSEHLSIPDDLIGRFIVNPHVAYYSKESLIECRMKAAKKVYCLLNDQSVRDVIV